MEDNKEIITNNTTIRLSILDRLRVLIGKKIYLDAQLHIGADYQPIKITTNVYVERLLKSVGELHELKEEE